MPFFSRFFTGAAELDHQIDKFRHLHDSYLEANDTALRARLVPAGRPERKGAPCTP